jgi:hypothetical protein
MNTLIQSKRRRLLAGLIEMKMEILSLFLAMIIGLVLGGYFGFVFFYLTAK